MCIGLFLIDKYCLKMSSRKMLHCIREIMIESFQNDHFKTTKRVGELLFLLYLTIKLVCHYECK